jgi:hypothetical protein
MYLQSTQIHPDPLRPSKISPGPSNLKYYVTVVPGDNDLDWNQKKE